MTFREHSVGSRGACSYQGFRRRLKQVPGVALPPSPIVPAEEPHECGKEAQQQFCLGGTRQEGGRAGPGTRPPSRPQPLPHRWVARARPPPCPSRHPKVALQEAASPSRGWRAQHPPGLKEAGNSLSHNNTQELPRRPLAPSRSRTASRTPAPVRRRQRRARAAQGTPAQQLAPRRQAPRRAALALRLVSPAAAATLLQSAEYHIIIISL
ncbi:uncharacterized protein LOC123645696 [Lemur catta]|uniref:uncharacterized protein LOC123645696 n=1 Tax=Lemur catta TaxID=9447 RepID=UPI001E26BF6B|nr:uncharacterized protein LOC123645696 [Lemur catta]